MRGDRFPFNLEPLELELDEIHDLAAELAAREPELVLCFNRPLSKPTPAVPARMLCIICAIVPWKLVKNDAFLLFQLLNVAVQSLAPP